MSTLSKRIKAARLLSGLSQEQLGIHIGIDPASASVRMNRYELGRRVPNFELVERLAEELGLPTTYFYSSDEEEAHLVIAFSRLNAAKRKQLLRYLLELQGD
ncbi:helix-turn-helix domain-containing protein [Pseudomonas rubra]|uniref:Helix-turn-helix domain-containing protein n=1 Tax=Pseudomonas rubra TaxID=2942627 RepID=A0ABT5P9U3_9PSED|nr:helix-turn-helix transcriptional regulator [Pseudomonas rubra]MDD1014793.1 helix-turn-helix domain-containing protein [Pseudomonas rubra]MDD1040758.1 helix-turn-helix domain-containing protein [Pseudomonas rubra]MDD1157712.1 helix-turn-helix domain-containing protein [Pseudomonas rubra]